MNDFLDLEGKVAVVAGGASGLGQAVARGLVHEGARVVLGDIDVAGLEQMASAGIISSASLAQMTEEEWDRVLAINTKGTFFCIQEAVTRMIPLRRGRIITIGSDSVARGGGRIATAAYTASKGAVVALTRNIARDLLGTGIGVNCVNPGPIDSPMHAPLTPEQRARVTGSIPLGWMAKPEEIANGILFLSANRAASFMYGTNLNIDGGTQMGAS